MEKFYYKLNKERFESTSYEITGKEILSNAGLEPVEDYELLLRVHEKGFEPVQLDEKIDLREPGIEGLFAKPYQKLIISVDDEPLEMDECFATPRQVLEKLGKSTNEYFLSQVKGDREIGYKNDPDHKIGIRNGLVFRVFKLKKTITIYINGTPEEWKKRTISFEEVVKLAYPTPPYPNTEYQVVYAEAKGDKEGTLAEGQEVKIKEGTQFDVTATDKS